MPGDGPQADPLAALAHERIDYRFKGLPPDAEGLTVGELAAARRNLFTGGFTTPVLSLSAPAVQHNLRQLAHFADAHGLALAPHGKTSMAPWLLHRQLAHGAWGITAAVPAQVRVYRAFGIRRIFLANQLVDAAALRWIAAELDADPDFRFIACVDSVRGVRLMDAALRAAGASRPVEVAVELGVPDGRTGVRSEDAAVEVADAVAAADTLRLVGVSGYEGEVPEATEERVRRWLRRLTALAAHLDAQGRFGGTHPPDRIVVSAGGSAWFDTVAEVFHELPPLSVPVLKLLRSGAYVAHDDGHYRRLTPYHRRLEQGGLRAAFRLWAQVVSRPEPSLAFVNAGKRDAPQDMGLPEVQVVRDADGRVRGAEGLTVTRLSDQHARIAVAPEAGDGPQVGDWLGLGLSHPCTVFDRWPLIPMTEQDGTVTDYLRTFF